MVDYNRVLKRWRVLILAACAVRGADVPGTASPWGRLKPTLEFRTWFEDRQGLAFGKSPDYTTLLVRTRFNLDYRAMDWLHVGGTFQDTHAPGYSDPKPGSALNPTELHEAYLEMKSKGDRGWGGMAGRRRLSYGSQNLIGLPEWSNGGRTYDGARVYWQNPAVHLEALYVSSVKFNPNGFDRPVLGDHVAGTYNVLSKLVPHGAVDLFLLRHDQNQPGGFAGPGTLKTLSYGGRIAGSIGPRWKYDAEAIGQSGEIGLRPHRAFATNLMGTRSAVLLRELDWIIEYKYASGTADPRAGRSGTYDQLYPANHDRFGHADLLGWRNLSTVRWINRLHWGRHTTINVTYTNNWLAQARDGLYDSAGRLIGIQPAGTAGRHVGQEWAIYTQHRLGHFQLGVAYAHWWLGDFVKAVTPGVSPRYFYLHQTFVFP